MKKIYTLLIGLVLALGASAQCSDLYFSEYAEGSSNHKYLEIYNPTSAAINLSGYSVFMINNGGSPNNVSFALSGMIQPYDVYVMSTNQADTAGIQDHADTTFSYNSVTHFNGDDALCLINGVDTIDVIGVRWMDPGSSWAVGSGTTANHTLVRKASVDAGQTDWTIGATEWDVYPQNTWDNIGTHLSVCAGIRNAGYDIQGDDSYRDFWRNRAFEDSLPNTNLLQITSSPVHMGAKAGKLPSSGDRIAYQAIGVKPGTTYTVKFWYTMKTSPVGTLNVTILDGDLNDPALVPTSTIISTNFTDQTDANTYVQDSITFTAVSDVAAIYITNVDVECRFDSWEIAEDNPFVAVIQNHDYDSAGSDSHRDFWRNDDLKIGGATNVLQITSGPTHMGPKAAKLPSDGSRIGYQAFEVKPGDSYTVTFWYTMKTSPVGSATVSILDGHVTDNANIASATIASTTVMDQTDANMFLKDSVVFTAMSDTAAIYFTNMGVETRFDTWGIYTSAPPAITMPMVAAADPTAEPIDVISLFSNVYTDVTVDTWRTGWSNATLTDIQVAGNDVKEYSALDFVGIETVGANSIDATGMDYFTFDAWTADATTYRVKLVDFGADNAFGGGDDTEHEIAFANPAQGMWNNHKIDLTDFSGMTGQANISQIIFSALPTTMNTLYLDNIYFSRDPVYVVSSIEDAIQLDADLAPTNEDALFELTGIVYGIDLDGNNGLSFTIIDSTSGINIFNFNDVSNYVVTEGDEITARGKIDFYNGLLELFVDSIKVNSTGNAIEDPTMVTVVSEATESEFIQLEKVWIADTTTVWPDNGNVWLTNEAADTFQIRIDRDIPGLVGKAVAFDTMTIVGIGGQFDGSAPYTEGYQIFPRDSADIMEWQDPTISVEGLKKLQLSVYPNPTQGMVNFAGDITWDSYRVYSAVGVEVLSGTLNNQAIDLQSLVNGYYFIETVNEEATGVTKVILSK